MAWLNDSRVDRSHRDFRDAYALDLQEAVLTIRPRNAFHRVNHRMHPIRPVLVKNQRAQIRVPCYFDAVLIMEFSLIPSRSRHPQRDRMDNSVSWHYDFFVVRLASVKYVVDALVAISSQTSEKCDETGNGAVFCHRGCDGYF